jgi:UrcA family protein
MSNKTLRMTWLAGAVSAGLFCLAGAASAQDYGSGYGNSDESVTVQPPHGEVRQQPLPGWNRIGKTFDPETQISLSAPVNLGDLNLHRMADRDELRYRISLAAMRLCSQLKGHMPGGSLMETTDIDCVTDATRQAMDRVS